MGSGVVAGVVAEVEEVVVSAVVFVVVDVALVVIRGRLRLGFGLGGRPGPWRYAMITMPKTMKPRVTIWAVGIPKNVQLPLRRNSRTNRVVPYQMKKIPSRSPGNEPLRVAGEPDQDKGAEEPGQRLVQEQRMEVRRRDRVVDARVGGDAVGAVDRDAPRQRRRRAVQLLVEEVAEPADRLHHEQRRRHDVGPDPEASFQRRVRNQAAIVPVMIPPGTPSPVNPENAYEPSGWRTTGRIARIGSCE